LARLQHIITRAGPTELPHITGAGHARFLHITTTIPARLPHVTTTGPATLPHIIVCGARLAVAVLAIVVAAPDANIEVDSHPSQPGLFHQST